MTDDRASRSTDSWEFLDKRATFRLPQADRTRYLYFPLVGAGTPYVCVTPGLAGDHTAGHDAFLSVPSSVESLHESRWRRSVWLNIDGHLPWAADGGSALQRSNRFSSEETAEVTAGPLWHRVTRRHSGSGVEISVTSVVPPEGGVESLCLRLQHTGSETAVVETTVAIPIYGRSADSIRDHRHVTSLLNDAQTVAHGVVVRPTMIFDERGHRRGDLAYFVYGWDHERQPPASVRSSLPSFTGERGDLDWPAAVVAPDEAGPAGDRPGDEIIAALTFAPMRLQPGETREISVVLGIGADAPEPTAVLRQNGAGSNVIARTTDFWDEQLDALRFSFGDPKRDGWLRWVGLQPILRRNYGNSFLPYHDYGRGGRGWRDLWQDSLALLLMDDSDVEGRLFDYFAGVRMDGTNATIIGQRPGEFLADRNAIARVWMDHGAWPLLTVRVMLDRTGDPEFLLRRQDYFRDRFVHRARSVDEKWTPASGTVQQASDGTPWKGSILEHLLIQHLTAYFNAGEHGCLRLEDADWNDGMDLGAERGESVAFTAFYAGNLSDLADLVDWLRDEGHSSFECAAELGILLDGSSETDAEARRARLDAYVDALIDGPSGMATYSGEKLAADLRQLSRQLAELVRKQEWIKDQRGGWFNGYYDNHGRRVEGRFDSKVRMTLTGQAFPLLSGIASADQARSVYDAARTHLWSADVGGFRLNTDFEEVRMDLGRAFGFAYGHKENGAMFTHMAVMFAAGLARYGLADECWELMDRLFQHSSDFPVARMYPGLPEYVDPDGRGRYPWLTGSAAWYLFVLLSSVVGIRGDKGDLLIEPALPADAFSDGPVSVDLGFAGRRLKVTVQNPDGIGAGLYCIGSASLAGRSLVADGGRVRIDRSLLMDLASDAEHHITIGLILES